MTDTPQVLLAHHLKTLKLPTFLREYDKLARHCATEGADHVRYLVRLTELELIDRERRMVERRIRQARFPAVKSLDSFDFKAIASLNKMLVLELARCEYVERRENIIALGNSGTGKTHHRIAIGRVPYSRCLRRSQSRSDVNVPLDRGSTAKQRWSILVVRRDPWFDRTQSSISPVISAT